MLDTLTPLLSLLGFLVFSVAALSLIAISLLTSLLTSPMLLTTSLIVLIAAVAPAFPPELAGLIAAAFFAAIAATR